LDAAANGDTTFRAVVSVQLRDSHNYGINHISNWLTEAILASGMHFCPELAMDEGSPGLIGGVLFPILALSEWTRWL
jgi:hypothetical protein